MKFIFIGGSGRSGTTLVQKILIIHSKIAGTGEFEYLEPLLSTYKIMNEPNNINNKQKNFYNQKQLKSYWNEFIENLFLNVYNSKEGVEYISEKSPNNIFVAQTLLDLIPDSKFIFIYRDGRDVVSSFKQVNLRIKQNKNLSPMKYLILTKSIGWVNIFNIYNELINNPIYVDRVFPIRYEDLVNKPQVVIKEMMGFIGLDLETEQLDPSSFGINDSTLNRTENFWYTEKMHTQKINAGNIGKWTEELTLWEKFIANIIMANRLREEGYEIKSFYLKLNWLFFKMLKIFKVKYYKWR